MSDQSINNYLFVLYPSDMRDIYAQEWPEGIALVVWRQEAEDDYYLLPQENIKRDLIRITQGLKIPVFPEFPGYAVARISYTEESDLVQNISRRSDLLKSAQKISSGSDNSSTSEDGFEDFDFPNASQYHVQEDSSRMLTSDLESDAEAIDQESHIVHDEIEQDRDEDRIDNSSAAHSLIGFSHFSKAYLTRKKSKVILSISNDILSQLSDTPAYILPDSSKRKLALVTNNNDIVFEAKRLGWKLTHIDSINGMDRSFIVETNDSSSRNRLLYASRYSRSNPVHLTLHSHNDDAIVFDAGNLFDTRRTSLPFSKIYYAFLVGIIIAMGYVFSSDELLDPSFVETNTNHQDEPSFNSDQYMKSLIDNLFPES